MRISRQRLRQPRRRLHRSRSCTYPSASLKALPGDHENKNRRIAADESERLSGRCCRMSRSTALCVAAGVYLVGVISLFAHDTWISPSVFTIVAGQEVRFDITSGMKFPALEAGPKADRIAKAGFRLGGETGELKNFVASKEALRVTRSFAGNGLATAWLQSLPKQRELTDSQVAEYLEEARAPSDIRSAWERQKGKAKWKEEYIKCAKTAVAVGDAAGDESWGKPVGLNLEIVPVTNPTTIKAGESAAFKMLRDGKPLPNAALALVREGSEERVYQTTDAEGVATFPFAKPGKHLLTTMILELPASEPPLWHSNFSTFTLEVR